MNRLFTLTETYLEIVEAKAKLAYVEYLTHYSFRVGLLVKRVNSSNLSAKDESF